MSFKFVNYKIKDYVFTGITDILSNKSEYFNTIDLDKVTEVILSDDLIKNEAEYKIFELFWRYLNSLLKINFIDDLNLQELKYIEYLTNYFNIDLNEIEIKYIIEKEIIFSDSKEQVYPIDRAQKPFGNFTEKELKIIEVYPLYQLEEFLNRSQYQEFIVSDSKDKFVLDNKKLQQIIINWPSFIKELYDDGDIGVSKYEEYILKFYLNLQKIIEIDNIKIKKITLNINTTLKSNPNKKYYITANKKIGRASCRERVYVLV